MLNTGEKCEGSKGKELVNSDGGNLGCFLDELALELSLQQMKIQEKASSHRHFHPWETIS